MVIVKDRFFYFLNFYQFETILSHIPMPTRSNGPNGSSLSAKFIPNQYLCEINVFFI